MKFNNWVVRDSSIDGYHSLLDAMIEGAERGLRIEANSVEQDIKGIIQPCINFFRQYEFANWHENYPYYEELAGFLADLSADIHRIRQSSNSSKQELSNSLLLKVSSDQAKIEDLLAHFEDWKVDYINSMELARLQEEQRIQEEHDRLIREEDERQKAEEEKEILLSKLRSEIDLVKSDIISWSPSAIASSSKLFAIYSAVALSAFVFSSIIWYLIFSGWLAISPAVVCLSGTCVITALIAYFSSADDNSVDDIVGGVGMTVILVFVIALVLGVVISIGFWLFNIDSAAWSRYLPIGWRSICGFLLVFPLGALCTSLMSVSAYYFAKFLSGRRKLAKSLEVLADLEAKLSRLQEQYAFA